MTRPPVPWPQEPIRPPRPSPDSKLTRLSSRIPGRRKKEFAGRLALAEACARVTIPHARKQANIGNYCVRGLEHGNRCDFPGSGKSCNKSNTTGADAPEYSAACSVSGPLPGVYVTVRQARASALLVAAPPVSGSRAARAGRAAFRDELGDVRVRRRYAGQHFVIQPVARRAGCLGA